MSCRVFDIPSEHALPESSTIGGAGGSSSEEETARIRATFEGFLKLRKKH